MQPLRRLCLGAQHHLLRPSGLPLGPLMAETRRRSLRLTLILLALGSLLAACGDATPLWGPNSPRNGADQPVDPVYGTPIPGYPAINMP